MLLKNIKYMLARDSSRAIGIACASGSIQIDCVHSACLTSGDRPSTLITMYFLYTSIASGTGSSLHFIFIIVALSNFSALFFTYSSIIHTYLKYFHIHHAITPHNDHKQHVI